MSGCGEVDLELVFYRDTIRHGTGRGFKQRGRWSLVLVEEGGGEGSAWTALSTYFTFTAIKP